MSTTICKKETLVSENSGIYFGVNSLQRNLAETIVRRMKALDDINPYEVARRAHEQITAAGIRKIMKGETNITLDSLVIIAEALDTSAVELLAEALGGAAQKSAGVQEASAVRIMGKIRSLPSEIQKSLEIQIAALGKAYGTGSSRKALQPKGEPPKQRIPIVKVNDWAPENKKK